MLCTGWHHHKGFLETPCSLLPYSQEGIWRGIPGPGWEHAEDCSSSLQGLTFVLLCSDLGDTLFTSTNTATGHFQKNVFILLKLQFLTGNYKNWHAVFQCSLVCLALTAELPGPPLIPEPKPGASGWCEHCCWHSIHGLFWGWMSLTSHLPAERCQ